MEWGYTHACPKQTETWAVQLQLDIGGRVKVEVCNQRVAGVKRASKRNQENYRGMVGSRGEGKTGQNKDREKIEGGGW